MRNHKAEAVKLLAHYFETVFRKSGLVWDSDAETEIEEAVENIIAAAVAEAADDLENYVKPEAMI